MFLTNQNRIAGLLLIASSILTVGTYLITPGLALVDPVETTDLINWGGSFTRMRPSVSSP